jgi:hypothetical protein
LFLRDEDWLVSWKAGDMRNYTENSGNSMTGSSLYCVWVPVHDDRGDRLVSIWIDPVLTAFRPQMEGKMHEVGWVTAASSQHEQQCREQFETETLNLIRTDCD